MDNKKEEGQLNPFFFHKIFFKIVPKLNINRINMGFGEYIMGKRIIKGGLS